MGLAVGPGAGGSVAAPSGGREVLRLVEWLKRQDRPISEELWAVIVRTALQTQDMRAAQRAQQMLADRIDPIPRADPSQSITVGGNLTVLRWDMTAPEIPPASHRTVPRNGYSNGSNGSASSSAIADGERPPSV